ncbi:unnamed protein product, partial [Allacma fusca]
TLLNSIKTSVAVSHSQHSIIKIVVASCWGSELDEIKDGSLGNRTRSVLTPSIEAVSISSTSPSSEGVGTTLVRKRRGARRETTTRKGLSNILVTTPNADRCID